jgi:hypothetical protein
MREHPGIQTVAISDVASGTMCPHQPPCPTADRPDRLAARTIHSRPEQGWSLLCNGLILFDDAGLLLPDGREVPPSHRTHPRLPVAA